MDFFPSVKRPCDWNPVCRKAAFPEHHHDFHEIVIVNTYGHSCIFNGQPYTTISGGTVCLFAITTGIYEHTDNLCLTNVLWRFAGRFHSRGAGSIAAAGAGWLLSFALAVNQSVLRQVRQLVCLMERRRQHGCACRANRETLCLCNYWCCCAAVAR